MSVVAYEAEEEPVNVDRTVTSGDTHLPSGCMTRDCCFSQALHQITASDFNLMQ